LSIQREEENNKERGMGIVIRKHCPYRGRRDRMKVPARGKEGGEG